jgi:hypothetical protein
VQGGRPASYYLLGYSMPYASGFEGAGRDDPVTQTRHQNTRCEDFQMKQVSNRLTDARALMVIGTLMPLEDKERRKRLREYGSKKIDCKKQ